jgi:cytidine deaminase
MLVQSILMQSFKNGNNSSFRYQSNYANSTCGSCRQSIAEYEIKQEMPIEIYFMGEIGFGLQIRP